MCKSVIEVLKAFLKVHYNLESDEEVEKVFKEMQTAGKLCYEAWG